MTFEEIMRPVIITIDEVPESLNVILNWHWTKREKNKRLWELLVFEQVHNKHIQRIELAVKIHIVYCFDNKHRHDWDNYIGGSKALIDALKQILPDDNMDVIREITFGNKISKTRKTIITITPIEERSYEKTKDMRDMQNGTPPRRLRGEHKVSGLG